MIPKTESILTVTRSSSSSYSQRRRRRGGRVRRACGYTVYKEGPCKLNGWLGRLLTLTRYKLSKTIFLSKKEGEIAFSNFVFVLFFSHSIRQFAACLSFPLSDEGLKKRGEGGDTGLTQQTRIRVPIREGGVTACITCAHTVHTRSINKQRGS